MKNRLTLTLILIGILVFPSLAKAQNSWSGPRNVIWEKKLQNRVTFLSDSLCQGRGIRNPGQSAAAFHLINIFRNAGIRPLDGSYAKHIYMGDGLIGHNIMAIIPGERESRISSDSPASRTGDRKYVLIGAHYDGLGTIKGRFYPGADANASGVTAMTSLAEMLQARKKLGWSYPYHFIFVAFDGYQKQLAGSRGLWTQLELGMLHDPVTGEEIRPENIALMINLDQIGSSLTPLASGREDYLIMLGNDNLAPGRQKRLGQCNRFFDIDLELCYDYYGSKNFTEVFYKLSDQRVFIEHGIPSVLFTSGITMNTNRTWDQAETLNYPVLKKRIYLIFHWLENIL